MKNIKYIYIVIFVVLFKSGFSQKVQKISWEFKINSSKLKVGDEATITATGIVPPTQTLYTTTDCTYPCVIEFKTKDGISLMGNLQTMGKPTTHYDDIFACDRVFFNGKGVFTQKIKITKIISSIIVRMDAQTCSDESCNNERQPFVTIPISVSEAAKGNIIDTTKPLDTSTQINTNKADNFKHKTAEIKPATAKTENKDDDLFGFMLEALAVGFLAIFTPCVFPMLPMTVSFFIRSAAKDEEEKKKAKRRGIRSALLFGLFVIVIYTIPGALISGTKGPEFNNWLSTHWAPNIFFFLVFLVFGFSFLGWFEIILPSRFVNKMESKSSKDSIGGLFFMAFTLVLVSFSCTGPFVGSLLVEASTGHILKPVIGMFFFSLAIALPFVLFAIFPSMMLSLPKPGRWLNAVKVSFGFFELAFAFKFLSIPDQTYHWGILSRDIFFAIWIVVFLLWGLYLLGKIKLPHDTDMTHIGVPRLLMAIIVLAFTVYMIPGMWGAPVKLLAGITPPMQYQEFNINGGSAKVENHSDGSIDMSKVKYHELHQMPNGLKGFFDFNEASAYSKKVNKPILIDFTGNACTNCRKMEENIWVKPEVLNRMKDSFVLVSLYTDDRFELPENEWYTGKRDGEVKKTLGDQISDLQITRYKTSSQPQYIITDSEGNNLLGLETATYNSDEQVYIKFLDKGYTAYKKKLNN